MNRQKSHAVILTADEVAARLHALGDRQHAAILARFFKTGPGEYGEGDQFAGVRVPQLRRLAREFRQLPLVEAERLLQSEIHELRLVALLIWVFQAGRGDARLQQQIYDLYLANTRRVNNWDLVDLSAPQLVGAYLAKKSRRPLYRLTKSLNLWERRMAVMATFHFIRQGDFADTLRIAELLLADRADLIHKAAGWMLREIGKRDPAAEEGFLKKHSGTMPRTMLRYAIERFPEGKRRAYLAAAGATGGSRMKDHDRD
jgi:3-methyladenine DNA glycosylase AlkD